MAFLFYFERMKFVLVNGKLESTEGPSDFVRDHSYRYGDGLFETMKVKNGVIAYADDHFERLFSGIELLKFRPSIQFTKEMLAEQILDLCRNNKCDRLARVRLSLSRGGGGLYDCDNNMAYAIECWPLKENLAQLNENGLEMDIFPDARKSCDKFSNIKSANYLPHVMAAVWARDNNLNDAFVLNQYGHICDATISNVFWIKQGVIFTPPLSEGCIAGVVRKKILRSQIQSEGFLVKESIMTERDLFDAEEVFLTNVISGIRWVKRCRDTSYTNRVSSSIFPGLF